MTWTLVPMSRKYPGVSLIITKPTISCTAIIIMCIVESMKCNVEVQNRNLGQDEEMAWYSWRQVASLQLDFLRNVFPPKKDMEATSKKYNDYVY